MPKEKDLKRLTRARMRKTGESYTSARAQLREKKERSPAEAETDFATLGGMSDDAVRAKTGRTWKGWVRVLDAVDAASMEHKEIAVYVHQEHGVSDWWAQTVTVGYERIRGLRDVGQRRGGAYEANKSKTFPVPIDELYRAFAEARMRDRWLPDVAWTVRTATPDKSMRITWGDETSVHLYFTAKGEAKSQVAVQHAKLGTKAEVAKKKEYWGERLAALGRLLSH